MGDWRLRRGVRQAGKRLLRRTKRYFAARSLVGDPRVFENDVFPWTRELEASWRAMRNELDSVMERTADLLALHDLAADQKNISSDDWKIFAFYGFGQRSDRNCSFCPETARLIDRIPGVQNAWFSILSPGAHIPRHKGITKGLIRLHLGLLIPYDQSSCWMRLNDEIDHTWREGEAFVFDDTKRHEVWNRTDEPRAVLLVDFERPLRPVARALNRLFLALLRRTAYYVDGRRRQLAWESVFHTRPAL